VTTLSVVVSITVTVLEKLGYTPWFVMYAFWATAGIDVTSQVSGNPITAAINRRNVMFPCNFI
jgi:hypothetical protein